MSGCNSEPNANPQPQKSRDVTEPRLRPGTRWVCGHSELGFACANGPSASGACGNQQKICENSGQTGSVQAGDNDSSACSSCALACHSRTNASGTNSPWKECEAAANSPCVPVRSGWSFRSTLAINLAVVTSAILLCLMFFPQREATFVPGGLSSKHAQILDNKLVSERCSLCHPNSHTKSKIANALATQDELCIRCHASQLPQLHLASPHDLSRSVLKQMSLEAVMPNGMLISSRTSPTAAELPDTTLVSLTNEIAAKFDNYNMETQCASCHSEHHGREHDLQAITDQRCQACHAKQFASFNSGHPEFKDFPRAQPRSIAFTHQAHMEKHFSKKNETFDCTKCHVDSQQIGGVGSVFRTLGFDTACARCHDDSINSATADGWVMLQLPSIKPADALAADTGNEGSRDLSDWPVSAQFGYEGIIPLAMRTLLGSDKRTAGSVALLPISGELKAITNFDTIGPETTLQIAAGTRELIREIAADGQAAWRKRLETVLIEALERDLQPREIKLIEELCAGVPPDIFRRMEQNWFGNDAARLASNSIKAVDHFPSARLVSARQDDELLDDSLVAKPQTDSPSDDDLLLSNPGASNANGTLEDASRESNDAVRKPKKFTKLRGAVHVVEGGWYLDDETLSLRYMPRGHNDRKLAAWAEFSSLLASSTGRASLAHQVPGGCTQCHALDNRALSMSAINDSVWRARSKPATLRELTKFDHTPHLTLPALADCKYCHKLLPTETSKLAVLATVPQSREAQPMEAQPSKLVSTELSSAFPCEFKSMHLDQCSACHRPNAANTGCTQCHNYHVTAPIP